MTVCHCRGVLVLAEEPLPRVDMSNETRSVQPDALLPPPAMYHWPSSTSEAWPAQAVRRGVCQLMLIGPSSMALSNRMHVDVALCVLLRPKGGRCCSHLEQWVTPVTFVLP